MQVQREGGRNGNTEGEEKQLQKHQIRLVSPPPPLWHSSRPPRALAWDLFVTRAMQFDIHLIMHQGMDPIDHSGCVYHRQVFCQS